MKIYSVIFIASSLCAFSLTAFAQSGPPPEPLSFTPAVLPGGGVGAFYSVTLAASGGVPGYSWSFASGTVANGLSIDPTTGQISGTLAAGGFFPINVTVTDAFGAKFTRSYGIDVLFIVGTLPRISLVGAYSATLLAEQGSPPYIYTWSISQGNLPAGLSLNSSTGAITGAATTTGVYNFTVKVTDSSGNFEEYILAGMRGMRSASAMRRFVSIS